MLQQKVSASLHITFIINTINASLIKDEERKDFIKKLYALAGVVQWTAHRPANRRVTGLIPCQHICLCCRPGPQLWACVMKMD